jgi:molybdate/tungstate transport system permease protein
MMKNVFIILGGIIVFFILFPLVGMIFEVSMDELFAAAFDEEVISSIFLTFRASLWATIAAVFFGVPFSWVLARFDFRGKKLIEGIIDLPVIIPHTAAGIALLSVWGRHSFFGQTTGLSIAGTEAAISVAMFFVSVPFLVNSLKSGLKLIDPRYEKVACTLGATPFTAFFTVTLLMLKKHLLNGSIMMWARGISEFGAVVVLAYHPMIAPVLIYDRYESFGLKNARPVAVLLILICFLIFIVLRMIGERSRYD